MPDIKLKNKDDYARTVTAFLAESLRTRKVSLERSVEISDKVVQNINLLDTEQDFLKLIKELSKDFEELHKLEERVVLLIKSDQRKKMETKVQEYATEAIMYNVQEATQLMEAAMQENATLDQLSLDFPQFKKYLHDHPNRN